MDQGIMKKEVIVSIIIVIVATIVYVLAKKIIGKFLEKSKKSTKKGRTYIKLFNNCLKYALLIVTVVAVLQVNGVNVSSIITGLGIVSAIVALALQDAVKDIVMGINIIVDEYFAVGDVLKIGEVEGKIMELGLKSTKMRDINTGSLFTISNRTISTALIEPDWFFINIPISYGEKIVKVEEVMNQIVNKIHNINDVSEVEYRGLNTFGDSAIYYLIKVYAKAELRPQVKRDANRIIKIELDANNMEIPYTQIDIHCKEK